MQARDIRDEEQNGEPCQSREVVPAADVDVVNVAFSGRRDGGPCDEEAAEGQDDVDLPGLSDF